MWIEIYAGAVVPLVVLSSGVMCRELILRTIKRVVGAEIPVVIFGVVVGTITSVFSLAEWDRELTQPTPIEQVQTAEEKRLRLRRELAGKMAQVKLLLTRTSCSVAEPTTQFDPAIPTPRWEAAPSLSRWVVRLGWVGFGLPDNAEKWCSVEFDGRDRFRTCSNVENGFDSEQWLRNRLIIVIRRTPPLRTPNATR